MTEMFVAFFFYFTESQTCYFPLNLLYDILANYLMPPAPYTSIHNSGFNFTSHYHKKCVYLCKSELLLQMHITRY